MQMHEYVRFEKYNMNLMHCEHWLLLDNTMCNILMFILFYQYIHPSFLSVD